MWPDVEEQVAVEQAEIDQLFEAYQAAISKSLQMEPDFIELSALATMLHSFYTGIENIFKRVALEIDGDIPSGCDPALEAARPAAQGRGVCHLAGLPGPARSLVRSHLRRVCGRLRLQPH